MAYQSEIELRVKVNDVEIERLEKRIDRLNKKPGLVAGKASSVLSKQLRLRKGENQLIKNNLDLQNKVQQAAVRELNTRTQFVRLFKDAAKIRASYAKDADRAAKSAEREAAAAQKTAAATRKQRIQGVQGAVAGGVISAAFPILTGGGAAESVLGGAGGLLGSLAGPLGSFAGGIGGSALGRIIQDAENLDLALSKLNGIISDVGGTSDITASQIGELANQLGIAKEEAVDAVAAFSDLNSEQAIEATKAFADVGGRSTLEALATAGIDRESALQSIVALEKVIGNELAQQLVSDLQINDASLIQAALIDAVADKQEIVNGKTRTVVGFWENIKSIVLEVGAALGGYDVTAVPSALDLSIEGGPKDANKDIVDTIIDNIQRLRAATASAQSSFKPSKADGALPQSKELQLRAQILKTELSLADIETKRRALKATDLAAIKIQDQALYDRLTTEIQLLELARQQALVSSKVPEDAVLINQLYDQRLEKLQRENDLQREQNLLRGKQIKLQQTLTANRNKQETEGVVRGLTRKIEDSSSRDSVDSSASEMLALRIKQIRRQEDLIGSITNKIKDQNAIIASGDAKKIPAAEVQLKALQDRKEAIEALLPVLNQVEQAELRRNQLMEKYGFIANEAATAMSSAVQSVITGTGSVQEAFSDMFANIGKAFIDMATQMIVKALIMKAIGILTSAFGGGGGGGIGFNPSAPSITGNSIGDFGGGTPFLGAFAEGGYVTGPTNALIGEGGEPEYVIPESKMRESMGRYSRGSRGGSVIPAEGGGSAGTEGGTAVATPIDVRYSVERINSVDYVTADQFQSGMKRAALEGAQRGQQLTLTRLQQSPATRRRIGM